MRTLVSAGWLIAGAALVIGAASAGAGEADVLEASVVRGGDGTFRIEATVAHADTGWDHYVRGFEVVAPDGTILGVRTLLHPHVAEQPFTRALEGVAIPAGLDEVIVRARDSVHGAGGREARLRVPR